MTNFIAALHGFKESAKSAADLLDSQVTERFGVIETLVKTLHNASYVQTENEAVALKLPIPSDLFDEHTFFQVIDNGVVSIASNNAPKEPLFLHEPGFHTFSYNAHRWRTKADFLSERVTDDAAEFNLRINQFQPYIVIGFQSNSYTTLTEQIILKAILPTIWVLPLLGILVWLIIRRGLAPLSQLANLLANRNTRDLSALELQKYPVEMAPIVSALNGLFERVKISFDREKRFSADAAHELRTPLAILKLQLHNLPESVKQDSVCDDMKKSIDRMSGAIDQLLTLHRIGGEQFANNFKSINLVEHLGAMVADFYPVLASRNQTCNVIARRVSGLYREDNIPLICIRDDEAFFEQETLKLDNFNNLQNLEKTDILNTHEEVDNILLDCEPFAIEILFRNLLDNSSKYGKNDCFIVVSISEYDDFIDILVEDSGPGVPEAETAKVFDRFYRLDGDKNNSNIQGSGLGLSIVNEIVCSHQGKIRSIPSPNLGGFCVRMKFPKKYNDETSNA